MPQSTPSPTSEPSGPLAARPWDSLQAQQLAWCLVVLSLWRRAWAQLAWRLVPTSLRAWCCRSQPAQRHSKFASLRSLVGLQGVSILQDPPLEDQLHLLGLYARPAKTPRQSMELGSQAVPALSP